MNVFLYSEVHQRDTLLVYEVLSAAATYLLVATVASATAAADKKNEDNKP